MTSLDRESHDDLVSVVEDAVQYACDEHMLSGEVAWTVVQCLAIAKIAQLEGLVK